MQHYKFCIIILLLNLFVAPTQAKTHWYWQHSFSNSEKQKLQTWIEQTITAVEKLVGPYPFDLHITFHRHAGASEPVPWAQTSRKRYAQGAHFHVDPSYSLDDFLHDWTAPHELSHLIIPYLGAQNAWFAEGFASFMQYQVMQRMETLNSKQALEKYIWHIQRANSRFIFPQQTFVKAAPTLRARGLYPTMYWGGAVYFLRVNHRLAAKDTSLIKILRQYLKCCRMRDWQSLQDLNKTFDKISNSDFFSEELRYFQQHRGFPEFKHLF